MYTLYIDESGKASLRTIDPSRPHFSLSAIITKSGQGRDIKERADQTEMQIADSVASFLNMDAREIDNVAKVSVPEHQAVIAALRKKAFRYHDGPSGIPTLDSLCKTH